MGLDVLPVESIVEDRDAVVIIGTGVSLTGECYNQLHVYGHPEENIYYLPGGWILAGCGTQYFDLEEMRPFREAEEKEVFLDCGCLEGTTSREFMSWCHNNAEKIIAFEPDPRNFQVAKRNLDQWIGRDKYELHPFGLSDQKSVLKFSQDYGIGGTRFVNEGRIEVPVDTIDHVLAGRKATFIKMDIEGSELSALKGGRDTIQKYRPKLAISVYHEPWDILEIPLYIKQLVPEYRLYLRHYTTDVAETVLYAFV